MGCHDQKNATPSGIFRDPFEPSLYEPLPVRPYLEALQVKPDFVSPALKVDFELPGQCSMFIMAVTDEDASQDADLLRLEEMPAVLTNVTLLLLAEEHVR